MQYNWNSLDMALCLELALQKEGDKKENVMFTLNSLSKKTFCAEDSELPLSLQAIAQMPDPVTTAQMVVDNFFSVLKEMADEFVLVEADESIEHAQESDYDVHSMVMQA